MKTFKVMLKDYQSETVEAESFAVDDHNNLIVGHHLFHKDDWKRVTFLYEHAVAHSPYDFNDAPLGYAYTSAGDVAVYNEPTVAGYPTSQY